MGICCSFCHDPLKDGDLVTVNEMYIITHIGCPHSGLALIEVGFFGEIMKRYPDFERGRS